ncbi:DUF4406 domain-containing protein [Curtobacterium sp. MCLR17_036]|uniref:DUF4406 domain-containing protein n=1 Tax=Curtobacterium sp. MCLR17_036 TaxID=2175620 RepID=UPI000DA9281E|nr:DUF4406 domain-containing protein [Curtobacterium sp. MCLR17_036]WIE65927.1 DUF4406 domain-containing protein [Curtobacterium sp. MCLR17_036]
MKLYIAGPMTGVPEFNYPAFRTAESDLRALGYDVLNPITAEQHNTTGKPQSWEWYMRHALRMVVASDGVSLLPGWSMSRGAQLEHHVATQLGLDVRPHLNWIEDAA